MSSASSKYTYENDGAMTKQELKQSERCKTVPCSL